MAAWSWRNTAAAGACPLRIWFGVGKLADSEFPSVFTIAARQVLAAAGALHPGWCVGERCVAGVVVRRGRRVGAHGRVVAVNALSETDNPFHQTLGECPWPHLEVRGAGTPHPFVVMGAEAAQPCKWLQQLWCAGNNFCRLLY